MGWWGVSQGGVLVGASFLKGGIFWNLCGWSSSRMYKGGSSLENRGVGNCGHGPAHSNTHTQTSGCPYQDHHSSIDVVMIWY